jgi:putative intracellular protease/amidase
VDAASLDCLYLAGGHGCCSDFVSEATLKTAVEAVYAAGKIVAADCHGPIGLAQCVKPDGTPLVAGLAVTGFSDSEEGVVQQTGNVPFLIEAKFKEQGGLYESAADWNSKVCVAGNLITGQNPQSSDACAEAVVAALG